MTSSTPPGQPRPASTGFSAMAHGLDAFDVRLIHDRALDTWFVYLNPEMTIRIDPKDSGATLRRDRDGLRKLIDVATQLVAEIGQRLGGEAE